MTPSKSVPASASIPLPDDPRIRRSYLSPDVLLTTLAGDEVKTVADLFPYCARKHGDTVACWYRDILEVVEEDKVVVGRDGTEEAKSWEYYALSPPIPLTYNQLDDAITSLSAALINIGFTNPSLLLAERPRVSIYADTSIRWQLMSQAFARLGHTITTAYTTLGEEGLYTSLEEPEVELCFCGQGQLGLLLTVLPMVKRVRWVVYDCEERADQSIVQQIASIVGARGGRILTFNRLKQIGMAQARSPSELGPAPGADDLFCIMYTSGSTGRPKGVLLTHGNVVAAVAGSTQLWGPHVDSSDVLLAYLPLTHILEQFLEFTYYFLGVPVAYGSVRTLLDESVRNCQGDFEAYQPTLLTGVPAIFEMIRKGMMKKLGEMGPVVGTVFKLAVLAKQTLPSPFGTLIDSLLFHRVKQATGGRVRVGMCGGAALSYETQTFLSTVLTPMYQGYGLTESCGMATITTPNFCKTGSVGVVGPSCEIRLEDYPEAGYLSTNTCPQGEVWVRGPAVFKGYFKQGELTQESLTPDGWFKTGDIGQWNEDGSLSIIDRVKNLVKMQNGEYIALDKVEAVYKHCDCVMMLLLSAPPLASRPVAIVYPHEGNLRNHLKAAGLPDDGTPATWTADERVKRFLLSELREVAKKGGLKGAEIVRDVILTEEEWSSGNGMLTPAMKLCRPFINRKYAKEIERALKNNETTR